MASYQIYLPGVRGSDPNHLRRAGLEALLGEPGLTFHDVLEHGPDGGFGVCAWWDDPLDADRRPTMPGIHPELQTILPEPSEARGQRSEVGDQNQTPNTEHQTPRWYLVYETARPPRPEDLQRSKMQQGGDVVLEDGQAWHFPTARLLPHLLGLGQPRIKDRYKPFFDLAQKIINEWLMEKDGNYIWNITNAQGFDLACEALAINYRMTPAIAHLLGLVSSEQLGPIADVVTEGLALRRVYELAQQKKTLTVSPESPSTAPGEPAS